MPTIADQLVELQRIDSLADQHELQRKRSPLRAVAASANEQLDAWQRRRTELVGRIAELNGEVERDEVRGAEIANHLERLERQMKTVIALREAEALTHEIANLTAERDDLDIAELEAMEEQSELETALGSHLAEEPAVRLRASAADADLAVWVTDIDDQLVSLRSGRDAVASALPDDLRARYDRTRTQLGVAVATLDVKRCTGCNLDLSAAELDTVRADAAVNGYADCPQCGRILVL